VASSTKRPRRARGGVDTLPSGALRVRVYAGIDPLTHRRHYLTEIVPPGPKAEARAEQIRTRFLGQVDEQRNPRTRATVNQLMDRYLEVIDVEPSTLAP
jgi:integrase